VGSSKLHGVTARVPCLSLHKQHCARSLHLQSVCTRARAASLHAQMRHVRLIISAGWVQVLAKQKSDILVSMSVSPSAAVPCLGQLAAPFSAERPEFNSSTALSRKNAVLAGCLRVLRLPLPIIVTRTLHYIMHHSRLVQWIHFGTSTKAPSLIQSEMYIVAHMA
jgi:hypothetical protein